MENFNWEKIYKKVESQAAAAKEKLDKGLLIDKNEAAVIREKQLYDEMEKQREEERKKKAQEEKEEKEKEENEKKQKKEENTKESPKLKESFNAERELEAIQKFSEEGHSPEERKRRREIKHEMVEGYKENLALLKMELAKINTEMEFRISGLDKVDWQKERKYLIERMKEAKLDNSYVESYISLLDNAETRNETIDRYDGQFKGKAEDFYHHLYGMRPLGKIKIFKKPLCFEIICEDPRDFEWVHHDEWDDESIQERAKHRHLNATAHNDGIVIKKCRVEEMEYAVYAINNNALINRPDYYEYLKNVEIHEEKHVLDLLLARPKEILKDNKEYSKQEIKDQIKNDLFASFFLYARLEIFAYLKEGKNVGEVEKILSTNLSYDYPTLNQIFLLENDKNKLTRDEIDGIFSELRPKYWEQISTALAAVKKLQSRGSGVDKIIGLFQQEDPRKWQKLADRLEKQDEARKARVVPKTESGTDDENIERDPVRAVSWHTIHKIS